MRDDKPPPPIFTCESPKSRLRSFIEGAASVTGWFFHHTHLRSLGFGASLRESQPQGLMPPEISPKSRLRSFIEGNRSISGAGRRRNLRSLGFGASLRGVNNSLCEPSNRYLRSLGFGASLRAVEQPRGDTARANLRSLGFGASLRACIQRAQHCIRV